MSRACVPWSDVSDEQLKCRLPRRAGRNFHAAPGRSKRKHIAYARLPEILYIIQLAAVAEEKSAGRKSAPPRDVSATWRVVPTSCDVASHGSRSRRQSSRRPRAASPAGPAAPSPPPGALVQEARLLECVMEVTRRRRAAVRERERMTESVSEQWRRTESAAASAGVSPSKSSQSTHVNEAWRRHLPASMMR